MVQTVETSESECSWQGCDYKRARRRPRPSTKPGSGILPVFTHGTECASTTMSRYPYTHATSNVGHSQLDQYSRTRLQGQYPTRSKTGNPRRPVYSDVLWRCRRHVSCASDDRYGRCLRTPSRLVGRYSLVTSVVPCESSAPNTGYRGNTLN